MHESFCKNSQEEETSVNLSIARKKDKPMVLHDDNAKYIKKEILEMLIEATGEWIS